MEKVILYALYIIIGTYGCQKIILNTQVRNILRCPLQLEISQYTDLVSILYVEGIELRVLEVPLCVVFNCHDLDHGLVA